MKRFLSIFLGFLLIYGCTSDDLVLKDTDLQFSSQKWVLVQMTGGMVDSSTEGENMEWQESYVFNPDGTFVKTRERDSVITEAKGTFEMVEFDNDDADYLELTYITGANLAGNCSGEDTETLRYLSNTEIYNTWMACDGPGLYYVLEQD